LRFGADFLAAATYFSNRNGPIRHRTCSWISVSVIGEQCQHCVAIISVRVAKYFLIKSVLLLKISSGQVGNQMKF